MQEVLILNENELRQAITLDMTAVDLVADAFAKLSAGSVVMPPILRMDMEDKNAEVDVKTAYVPGLDGFAIKVSPGFFDNPKKGLSTTSGLMVVHDADTGVVRAVLLDNGYLTDVRTAAAGAVAARCLAVKNASRAAVIGTGLQARLQMQALALVRPIETVTVWGRDPEKAAACAEDIEWSTSLKTRVADSIEEALADAQIAVTTTPSREPLIDSTMLHPGLHITAMGSDAEHKNELAPSVIAEADLFVCDKHEQSARLGELHHAVGAGLVPEDMPVTELGHLVAGTRPGRQSDEAVTVCDLTGTGAQDTAIATYTLAVALENGFGTRITN
ncbi:MAG: cyclodeaminase [Alphaproteobacteria bacterium]|uniref:cyclodeaminase n=1 Tax=Pacificispira sp. TaxID=2888761 RepID=UPI001B2B66B8|nr:cyclodeaminase [Alphaproteobacteria bacterium]MBO6864598.1 cyclodeaminase [Alphaproteobacteria bacterium]MEC9264618.1 cyclodeaminase [Pseudomonadota bacterium]